jgi:sulfur relay (sulfurtransferase) DsrC/TusE family protein
METFEYGGLKITLDDEGYLANFDEWNSFPILGSVCKNVHQPKDCVNEDFLDPIKAWKIAGLPKPSEEVISYLKR